MVEISLVINELFNVEITLFFAWGGITFTFSDGPSYLFSWLCYIRVSSGQDSWGALSPLSVFLHNSCFSPRCRHVLAFVPGDDRAHTSSSAHTPAVEAEMIFPNHPAPCNKMRRLVLLHANSTYPYAVE